MRTSLVVVGLIGGANALQVGLPAQRGACRASVSMDGAGRWARDPDRWTRGAVPAAEATAAPAAPAPAAAKAAAAPAAPAAAASYSPAQLKEQGAAVIARREDIAKHPRICKVATRQRRHPLH